jgi:hypothetical protein
MSILGIMPNNRITNYQPDRTTGIVGVPEGWEVLRIGKPNAGEYYLAYDGNGQIVPKEDSHMQRDLTTAVAVVERIGVYRRITRAGVKALPFVARLRNHMDEPWTYGQIVAHKPGVMQWQISTGHWFRYAEIKDNTR